jgi:hypothetical protein
MRAASGAGLVLAVVLWAAPARAAENEVSGSAAWFTESGAALAVTLGHSWDIAGISLGPRVGFGYLTNPNSAAVPLDLVARIGLGTLYLEGQVGVWLVFARDPTARFHATGGLGLTFGFLRVGAEGGYLSSGALIGGRVSFAF